MADYFKSVSKDRKYKLPEKCPNTDFFLVHTFCIQSEYRKIPEETPRLDTFHAVKTYLLLFLFLVKYES